MLTRYGASTCLRQHSEGALDSLRIHDPPATREPSSRAAPGVLWAMLWAVYHLGLGPKVSRAHARGVFFMRAGGASSQVGQQVVDFLSSEPVDILDAGGRRTWFVPKSWRKYLGKWGPGYNQAVPYSVACWFSHRPDRGKMGFGIEVGPTEPPEERRTLVSALDEAGFRVGKLAYRDEAKYTRIYTDWKKVKDFEDESEIEGLIEAMWRKAQPKVEAVTETLKVASGL